MPRKQSTKDFTKPKRGPGRPRKTSLDLPADFPGLPATIKNVKIDLQKAIELRLKGLSYEDIGKHFKASKQAVQERLAPYVGGQDVDLGEFKKNRADLLAWKQAQTLAALTTEDIEKANPRDKAIIFGTLYDKERLERGQSTTNAAVVIASACRSSMDDE